MKICSLKKWLRTAHDCEAQKPISAITQPRKRWNAKLANGLRYWFGEPRTNFAKEKY